MTLFEVKQTFTEPLSYTELFFDKKFQCSAGLKAANKFFLYASRFLYLVLSLLLVWIFRFLAKSKMMVEPSYSGDKISGFDVTSNEDTSIADDKQLSSYWRLSAIG